MNIPAAATALIDSVRTKGTLGPGGQRSELSEKDAKDLDSFCQTIDNTSEADNEPDFDLNPKKGELRIKDAEYTAEIIVNGNSAKGSLTEVAQMKDKTTWILFMDTNEGSARGFEAYLDKNGSLLKADGFFVDRKDVSKSYEESLQK